MAYWNYRVIVDDINIFGEKNYQIKEVYYNDDNTINAISQNGISPYGNTKEELENDINLMLKALNLPILEESKIIFSSYDKIYNNSIEFEENEEINKNGC